MWSLKKLSQKGDTIVEVLIVLTVLSLAFSISSATASKGLQQARTAEEHGQAMGILNSQTEMLRKGLENQVLPTTGTDTNTFCMTSSSSFVVITPSTTACTSPNGLYSSSIKTNGTYYSLKVTWQGLGTSGTQTEEYNYRTYAAANSSATGSNGSPTATTVIPPPPVPSFSSLIITAREASPRTGVATNTQTLAVNPAPGQTANYTIAWSYTLVNPVATSCTLTGSSPVNTGSAGSYNQSPVTYSIANGQTKKYTISCTSGPTTSTAFVKVKGYTRYKPLLRYWSSQAGTHFYTTNSTEAQNNVHGIHDFRLEGSAGYADTIQEPTETALYRFYSPCYRSYFYSTSSSRNTLNSGCYYLDLSYGSGVIGYVRHSLRYSSPQCPAGTNPLYQLSGSLRYNYYYSSYYNKYWDYFYTTDANEYQSRRDLSSVNSYSYPYHYQDGVIACTF